MRKFTVVVVVAISILTSVMILGTGMSIRTEKKMNGYRTLVLDEYSEDNWEKLKKKTIFFGHQSVGEDILNGIQEIEKEQSQISLKISEISGSLSTNSGVFNHCKIGRNTRPKSKIRAFRGILLANEDAEIDIALMKFCYVDISRDSNPQEIFELYSEMVSDLKRLLPDTVFIHVTVPIESMPQSAKGILKHSVKTLLGRPGVVEDNRVRFRYNELLRSRYSGKEPVFDLALFESVDGEGRLTVGTSGREMVEFMDPEKTEDGGHLNEYGRKIVGGRLLVLLAEIADAQD